MKINVTSLKSQTLITNAQTMPIFCWSFTLLICFPANLLFFFTLGAREHNHIRSLKFTSGTLCIDGGTRGPVGKCPPPPRFASIPPLPID